MCLAAFAAGLALSAAGPVGVLVALPAFAAIAAAGAPRTGALAAAALVAGAVLGSARVDAIDAGRRVAPPGSAIAGEAVLLEHPRPGPFGSSATVRMRHGPARGARLLARGTRGADWPRQAEPGDIFRLAGVVRRPRPPAPGAIDFEAVLRRRGVAGELALERLSGTGRRRGGLAGLLDGVRSRAERGIGAGLPADDSALARGLVLGQDELIPQLMRDDFRAAGLGHILAVSGQNVALLVALLLPVAMTLRLGRRSRAALLLAAVGLYVPLAGAGPPLQRAGVMAAAGLCALVLDRPSSRSWALGLAAAATLALNPRAAGDPGWQLSFAAVAGMLALGPGLRRSFTALPRRLGDALALTLAATLVTLPLVAFHFGSVALLGLPANLAALPAVAPVMWLGTLQALAGQLGAAGQALAAALGHVELLPLRWLQAVARRFGEAPGGTVGAGRGSLPLLVGSYAALAGAWLGLRHVHERLEWQRHRAAAAWRRLPRASRRLGAAVATAALVLAVLRLSAPPPPPHALTVSFLDVGQGDATLVQAADGAAVLFDGGPPEAGVARLLRRAGVRRLSAVVATHQSRDHQGGLPEVIRRFPVDLFVDGGDGTRDPGFLALERDVAARGIQTVESRAGLSFSAGALGVRILGPPPRPPGPPPEDPNPRGTVAVVSSEGFDLFLSADAESPALTGLQLPDVDAMKVSHHGSGDPGLPELLRRLRPELAGIEVGRGNRYGHPAPDTVAALEAAVPRVYRTDRDGTVRLRIERGRVTVETHAS